MESIGQRFKTARERKRVSLSQAAAKTRIKVQVLEAMEQDDFSKIPALTYSRGFIRMYAEFLGLEGGPLVQEFNALQGGKGRDAQPAAKKPEPKAAAPVERPPESAPDAPAESPSSQPSIQVSTASLRRAGYLVGAVVILIVAISLFARDTGKKAPREETPKTVAPKRDLSALVAEPSEPYVDLSAAAEQP
jgi:cytoskeletal protein RodZ